MLFERYTKVVSKSAILVSRFRMGKAGKKGLSVIYFFLKVPRYPFRDLFLSLSGLNKNNFAINKQMSCFIVFKGHAVWNIFVDY